MAPVPDNSVPDNDAGHAAPPFAMSLERGKIREFAVATGSKADGYLQDPRPVIPATFLRTSVFWTPPDVPSLLDGLNLDLRRILHGEQEYLFVGPPPRAGISLSVTTRVESVSEKEGRRGGKMTVIVIAQDFTDDAGRLVAQGRQTLIQTGKAPS